MLSIFEPLGPNSWRPSPLAAGPFAGLQGGAVAGLLTSELESLAAEKKWGDAIGVTAWFLRPAPMADLRTAITPITQGGRLNVIENTLYTVDGFKPIASARVTFAHKRPVDVQLSRETTQHHDPLTFPARDSKLPTGKAWFMEAMEMRPAPDIAWFRLKHQITPMPERLPWCLVPLIGLTVSRVR